MAGSCLEIALGKSIRVGKFAKSEAISSNAYALYLDNFSAFKVFGGYPKILTEVSKGFMYGYDFWSTLKLADLI